MMFIVAKLNLLKMDTSIENERALTIDHIKYWGLKLENGAFIRKGMKGEVQHVDNTFYYCENNTVIKELVTRKDLHDIVLPIANAEIAERNSKIREEQNKG